MSEFEPENMKDSLILLLFLSISFYFSYSREYREIFEAVFFIDRILSIRSPMHREIHSNARLFIVITSMPVESQLED